MERKSISINGMLDTIISSFASIPDHRKSPIINLTGPLMTSFAAFSLKYESFHSFFEELEKHEYKRQNVQHLYKVEHVPSTTQLKAIVDEIPTDELRRPFKECFRELQRGKVLDQFKFLGKYYLVPIDGTGYFSSDTIHCEECLIKDHGNGEKTYHHQLLAAAIVHPSLKQVIPLAPEPIRNGDGAAKNDCEREAAKRLLKKIRIDHPKLPIVVVEDGLASNAPHIRELQKNDMRYILGVKEGDHKYLFDWVDAYDAKEAPTQTKYYIKGKRVLTKVTQAVRFIKEVPLNYANDDLQVTFVELIETVEKKMKDGSYVKESSTKFTWVTDLKVTPENIFMIAEGGRKRWAIENETFNTLKNRGYNLEHNYGHGKKHLASNLAFLMMLAFFVDQVQELCCSTFQAMMAKFSTRIALWRKLRSLFDIFTIKCGWHKLFCSVIDPTIYPQYVFE